MSRPVAKPRMTLPPGYVAPPLERVPGNAADGSFERLPLHPLDVDGARFTYRGDLYIRPAERGIVLPDGDYEARIRATVR